MSRDITAAMMIIRDTVDKVAGEGLPEQEREIVKAMAGAALVLLERLLLDVNRIADALEFQVQQNR